MCLASSKRTRGKAGKKKKRLNAHESYQLLVGEMGVPRRDYLYLMPYWEIVLTVRGYYRRNILQYELQRIQAFSAAFAFGGNKNNISPRDFIPYPSTMMKAPTMKTSPTRKSMPAQR